MNRPEETAAEREARLLAEAEAEFSAEQVSLFQESIQAKTNPQDDAGKPAFTRFLFRMGSTLRFSEASSPMKFDLERRRNRIERFNRRNKRNPD